GGGCTSGAVTYTYTVGLAIFGFTPDHGDSSTTVTITGQGFVAPLIVTFGGIQGTVLSVTGTQILARPPSGCPGVPSGAIAVTLLSDGETATSAGSFSVGVPSISSFTPTSGPGGSPRTVTAIGTGFFPTGQSGKVLVTVDGSSVAVQPSETN